MKLKLLIIITLIVSLIKDWIKCFTYKNVCWRHYLIGFIGVIFLVLQSFIVEALVRQGTRHCRFSAGPVELDIFFSAQTPNLILMLALGSFLNYTLDSGQILCARPLIISRCNCGNNSSDPTVTPRRTWPDRQCRWWRLTYYKTLPDPLLYWPGQASPAQATIENYNSEYSVRLVLGLPTNILVLIDKTINQISSQKKDVLYFVWFIYHTNISTFICLLSWEGFFSSAQVLGRYLSPLVTLLV